MAAFAAAAALRAAAADAAARDPADSPSPIRLTKAQQGKLRMASMRVLSAVGIQNAEEDEDEDLVPGRRRKNQTFDTNHKLAKKWGRAAPDFAYG